MHHTVLVVDDDERVLKITVKMLEVFGYRVLSAATPAEAVIIFEAHRNEIDLLLSDVNMPGCRGHFSNSGDS